MVSSHKRKDKLSNVYYSLKLSITFNLDVNCSSQKLKVFNSCIIIHLQFIAILFQRGIEPKRNCSLVTRLIKKIIGWLKAVFFD